MFYPGSLLTLPHTRLTRFYWSFGHDLLRKWPACRSFPSVLVEESHGSWFNSDYLLSFHKVHGANSLIIRYPNPMFGQHCKYSSIEQWQQYVQGLSRDFPAHSALYQTANLVKQYTPAGATDHLETGSTANIWRHPTLAGVVIKSPATEPQDPRHKDKFRTEVNILKVLGAHPRIIQ